MHGKEDTMKSISLSLRQRKILNLVQNHASHITGPALAKQLDVSVRTIRSDIAEMNHSLSACNASIASEKSKGYYLECSDPISFQELFQTDDLLLTREDRIRYLTFQLCLSEIPLNQYDLEDEMYVSKTTLENDIASLKRLYVLSAPHIRLIHEDDTWAFEKDECKRRALLNHLFRQDWNYNTTGNAYYSYNFLDAELMTEIIKTTSEVLLTYNFQIEDPNLVTLNLALAIMYYRVRSGNTLPECTDFQPTEKHIFSLCEDLFAKLDPVLTYDFPLQEKQTIYKHLCNSVLLDPNQLNFRTIYKHLCNSVLLDANQLNFRTVSEYFPPSIIEMADEYLNLIARTFRVDFSDDGRFLYYAPAVFTLSFKS